MTRFLPNKKSITDTQDTKTHTAPEPPTQKNRKGNKHPQIIHIIGRGSTEKQCYPPVERVTVTRCARITS
jgi:hypothetical protein